jgi:hypothetical protein
MIQVFVAFSRCLCRLERAPMNIRSACPFFVAAAATAALSQTVETQGLTGTLIGTVTDGQGGVLAGARVTVSSPAMIGGDQTLVANDKG